VLGADLRVHEALGLFLGELERLLRVLAERDLDARREPLPRRSVRLELGLEEVHRDVRAREQLARRLLALLQETQQQVLGADRLGALLAGLVAGQEQDPLAFSVNFSNMARELPAP